MMKYHNKNYEKKAEIIGQSKKEMVMFYTEDLKWIFISWDVPFVAQSRRLG